GRLARGELLVADPELGLERALEGDVQGHPQGREDLAARAPEGSPYDAGAHGPPEARVLDDQLLVRPLAVERARQAALVHRERGLAVGLEQAVGADDLVAGALLDEPPDQPLVRRVDDLELEPRVRDRDADRQGVDDLAVELLRSGARRLGIGERPL